MPALAQAYGGGSFSAADKAVFVLCLLAPFVVPPTLMLWAYLRPGKLGLQFGQGLLQVEFAWRWGKLQHDRSVRSMAEFRITSMRLCPLALLLNGLTQARRVAHRPARLCWAGVAITGGAFLEWRLLPSLRGLVGE